MSDRSNAQRANLDDAVTALITIRDHARAVLVVEGRDTQIGTHYEGCWLHHRDCLAVWVAERAEHALATIGVPP